jgi:glycosyltransferase involved in cell wall biosynthesis
MLNILNVAFPFAPVGPDAVGGAEQVLYRLDQAVVRGGHNSIVIAQRGSTVSGTLLAVDGETSGLDVARERAWHRHRQALTEALKRWPVDVVHLHGIDFDRYVPSLPVPVLVTLHLPVSWYPAEVWRLARADMWLNCVSFSQHQTCPNSLRLLQPIENGVPVGELQARHAKRQFALFLGRICPEKGVHIAIDAAKRADISLLIAGEVFPYAAHLRYFEKEVGPRLDNRRRFIGPVGFRRKRRLLTAAQCLLVPSLVPETSSLVAREALACGTPVIGFAAGALAETIDQGQTGFIVRDIDGMARAIGDAPLLSSSHCRKVAAQRFSLGRMVERYLETYGKIAKARQSVA